jgi:hypothetical protein
MADGEGYAHAYGLTRQIAQDTPLSDLPPIVDELEDIEQRLEVIQGNISALADRASTTLQAPIPGAGRARSVYVELDGSPNFILTMYENGSCTCEWPGCILPTPNGTYHEVDPVDHTNITE